MGMMDLGASGLEKRKLQMIETGLEREKGKVRSRFCLIMTARTTLSNLAKEEELVYKKEIFRGEGETTRGRSCKY